MLDKLLRYAKMIREDRATVCLWCGRHLVLFWDVLFWSSIAAGGWLFGYLICITFNIGSFAR